MARTVLFDNSPYMRGWEERIGSDRITIVETGPAVSVFPINRETDGSLAIGLVRELNRSDTPAPILKALGGYLRGRDPETAANEIMAQKAGIRCGALYCLYERMEGFTTVILPIRCYLGLRWWGFTDGSAELVPLTLYATVDMVLKHQIPDQHAADVIMRLALLEARGRLPI